MFRPPNDAIAPAPRPFPLPQTHDGLPLPKAKVSGAKQKTAGFVFVGTLPFPLPRPPSMPVDRELVLFCTLALEAHLLVGLPQVLPFPLPPRP